MNIREWFLSYSSRDQKLIIALAAAVVLALAFLGFRQLQEAVSQREAQVQNLRDQLSQVKGLVAEAKQLQSNPSAQAVDTNTPPYLAVDNAVRAANLAASRIQPNGSQGVKIRFDEVSFDQLVGLIETLQQRNGLSVADININQRNNGTVSARITMERG